jgi:hypothetical protein
MPHFHPLRAALCVLLLALTVPVLALGDQQSPKAKIKKQPAAQTQKTAPQGTQTAPSDKEKKPPAPEEAGILDVKGMVVSVFPERHALVVRTTTNDYQIFATAQTVMTRDGKPVKLDGIHPGDRVESCRFNAKRVIQKLGVVSPGLGTMANPIPPKP